MENGKRFKVLYSSDTGHFVYVLRLIKLKTAPMVEVCINTIKFVLVEISRGKASEPMVCVSVCVFLLLASRIIPLNYNSFIQILDVFKIFSLI